MSPGMQGSTKLSPMDQTINWNFVLYKKGSNPKKEDTAAWNLKDWTKFTTQVNDKTTTILLRMPSQRHTVYCQHMLSRCSVGYGRADDTEKSD